MSRVLCIIEALGSGGAERQLTGLAALLKGDGYEVKVITYYPKDFYKHVLDKAGVEYEYLERGQSKFRRIPVLRKEIKRYSPDVVIVFSPSAAVITCLLKRVGFRYKLIVSERNTTQIYDRRERVRFFCYRWADWIVPNSHSQADFIKKHNPLIVPKTRVITNFVDTDFFTPPVVSRRREDICSIACVCRLSEQKNVLLFIEVVKMLKDSGERFKVDWYGYDKTDYGKNCIDKAKALALDDVLEFHGESPDVRSVYQSHDVLCLPSLYEGFPNVICEAMSCGLPILCSRVCDNPNIVLESINGYLFNPNDKNDITSTIRNFIHLEKAKQEEMGKNSRSRALELFSYKTFLKSYEDLIK